MEEKKAKLKEYRRLWSAKRRKLDPTVNIKYCSQNYYKNHEIRLAWQRDYYQRKKLRSDKDVR